jgi:hypothetical protein
MADFHAAPPEAARRVLDSPFANGFFSWIPEPEVYLSYVDVAMHTLGLCGIITYLASTILSFHRPSMESAYFMALVSRNYIQIILPCAIACAVGFVAVGIVSIFRRRVSV